MVPKNKRGIQSDSQAGLNLDVHHCRLRLQMKREVGYLVFPSQGEKNSAQKPDLEALIQS